MKAIKGLNGAKKWSEVVQHFDGRTENALKNRYNLLIEKQKKLINKQHAKQMELINYYLEKQFVEQFTNQASTTDPKIRKSYEKRQNRKVSLELKEQ